MVKCLKMATQVTSGQQKYLTNKLMKVIKRLSKVNSHIEYLEDCKVRKIIPRGINLPFLIKSGELWKGNKNKILNILNKSCEELLNVTLLCWKNVKMSLENRLKELKTN